MREGSVFLETISFFSLLGSNFIFSMLILKNWKGKFLSFLFPIIYAIICTLPINWVLTNITQLNEPASYVLLFIISFLSLFILLKISSEEALFLSIFHVFHMVFAKGIVAGAFSIILKTNMFQLFQVIQYAQLISCISFLLIFVLFLIYYLVLSKDKMHTFFLFKGQVAFINIINILMTIYLIFGSYSFYYNIELVWFSVEQIYTCIIFYLIFILIIKFGINTTNAFQNDVKNKGLELLSLSQRANLEYSQSLNMFIQSYKASSKQIKEFISGGKKLEAIEKINSLDLSLKTMPTINISNISNMDSINALFDSFIKVCALENINLLGDYSFNTPLSIPENELYVVLESLLKNALEANLKIKEGEKFIKIETKKDEKNATIIISNSYSRKPKHIYDNLESYKKNNEIEGVGFGFVKRIVEKHKGTIKFDILNKQKMISLIITLKLAK